MGHHQQSAFSLQKQLFQPGHSFIIHMISRFVQNQKIGRTHQNSGQCYTLALPAGKFRHRLIKITDPQLIKHRFSFALQLPGICAVHLLLQLQQPAL